MEVDSNLLEEFFAHCPELLFIADQEGTLLHLSEPLQRLLGAGAQGTALSAQIHPDDHHALNGGWSRLRQSTELTRFDFRLRGRDGSYQPVSCSARRSSARGQIHGSFREEVATPAQTRSSSGDSEVILRAVADNLPIVVWAIDAKGVFTHHDGKGLASVGLKPGQFLGMNIFELYPEDVLLKVRAALKGELEHSLTEAHGATWETWVLPVRDAAGAIVSVVATSMDISESKRVEAKLRAQIEIIEQQRVVIYKLATPIIEVWDRVLTLPLMGIVDSVRVDDVMQNLLVEIVRTRAQYAILDLTGVEVVDTGTAAHLLKLIQAIRLLGAEGIVTGIQPMVAETMVTLGLNLEGILTAANLRQGLRLCIDRMDGIGE